jgi:hypothetical protein
MSSALTTWEAPLRPPALLDARKRREAGQAGDAELRAASPVTCCGGGSTRRPRQRLLGLPSAPSAGSRRSRRGGNLLTVEEDLAKLRLVAEVARAAWG